MEMSRVQEIECMRRLEAATYASHLLAQGESRPGLAEVVADGLAARQELWEAHEGIVRAVAARWCRQRADLFDELVQEGYLILVDAMARFDWRREARLGTLAWPWLHRGMQKLLRGRTDWEERTTSPPESFDPAAPEEPEPIEVWPFLRELSPQERRVVLARAQGRTLAALAGDLGISVTEVRRLERRALRRLREAGLRDSA